MYQPGKWNPVSLDSVLVLPLFYSLLENTRSCFSVASVDLTSCFRRDVLWLIVLEAVSVTESRVLRPGEKTSLSVKRVYESWSSASYNFLLLNIYIRIVSDGAWSWAVGIWHKKKQDFRSESHVRVEQTKHMTVIVIILFMFEVFCTAASKWNLSVVYLQKTLSLTWVLHLLSVSLLKVFSCISRAFSPSSFPLSMIFIILFRTFSFLRVSWSCF